MSKGKKYNAAEKHFQKIIDSKNKRIKRLEETVNFLLSKRNELLDENSKLEHELSDCHSIINELKTLHNLTDEDIKVLLDKTKEDTKLRAVSREILDLFNKGVYNL